MHSSNELHEALYARYASLAQLRGVESGIAHGLGKVVDVLAHQTL